MARHNLAPSDSFNFRNPDDWPRWKRRFEQYRVASGLSDDSPEKQVNTLLYCLGEQAEAVLTSTNTSAEDRKVYDTVITKLYGFFKVRKNVIFERERFNRRNQQQGESAEQYIIVLYELAEDCEYGALHSEMIRDRVVVSIRDITLSEQLQTNAELTLDKAKKIVRQREAVHQQQCLLKGAEPQSIEALQHGSYRGNWRQGKTKSKGPPFTGKKCTRCAKGAHPHDKCPAKDAECHCCKKKGHYGNMCFSKTTADSVEAAAESMDTAFLDTLMPTKPDTVWFAHIQLNSKQTPFKLDTGAEVTAISGATHQHLGKPKLSHPDKLLYGPSRQPLKVIGKFKGTFTHKGRQSHQQVYVVTGLKTNLLGLPAITALNLAARIDTTAHEDIDKDIRKQFPMVFKGLENLGEEFIIKLKPEATPHALYTPRHVPLPLRPQVEEELQRMESLGVISKVDKQTQWCAGMVVVPKKNGKVRICIDLKPLNENVLREVQPTPKVDETLAQLTGAKVFSKLDANSEFWQIPLSESSRPLTTFITPIGCYYFHKLPFGISSAPEHFQKRMSAILSGLEGVVCQMDDVLVFGRDQTEHDTRLTAVLKLIESAGATLNPDKCEFSRKTLKFLGHILDEDGIRADPEKTTAI